MKTGQITCYNPGQIMCSQQGEAFRRLRTNVLFSSAEPGSRSLVVTSTGPNEGKTVVAANLAVALAQAGQRVLLLDGDLRRPTVHKLFDVEQEPGLSNLLVGNAKASDAVHKLPAVPGLWILAAGRVPPNPAELLGSARFRDLAAPAGDKLVDDVERAGAHGRRAGLSQEVARGGRSPEVLLDDL